MTMVWISAFEQPVTNEKDAIQAGLEGSEHYLDNIEHFSLLFLKDGHGVTSNNGRDQVYFNCFP